jgi:polar amino acid transport system substrate-binding protein
MSFYLAKDVSVSRLLCWLPRLCLLILLAPSQPIAQQQLNDLALAATPQTPAAGARREVLFLTLEYPPYASEAMHNSGAAVELLHLMLAGTQWQARVIFVPWSRVEHELKAGRADGALLLWPAEVKKYKVLSSSALFISRLGFYVRSAEAAQADVRLPAMKGQRVCIARGYGYPPELAASGVIMDEAASDEINLKRVSMKRCDYVALERAVGEFILSSDKKWSLQTKVVWKEPAFAELPLTIGLPPHKPDSAALLADLEKGLARLKQSPAYTALLKKYSLDAPR